MEVIVNCDGGLGNRINALILAKALAVESVKVIINWPVNTWCEAEYYDLFDDENVKITSNSLAEVADRVNPHSMYFHDDISSKLLGVPFKSVYKFNNIYDFIATGLSRNDCSLAYPALIPPWMSMERVTQAVNSIKFRDLLFEKARSTFFDRIRIPFYGLHLRRTDLHLPPNDFEATALILTGSPVPFLVCTDNHETHNLFQHLPNVVLNPKDCFVDKKKNSASWDDISKDDDGRLYASNVRRSSQAIQDAVVDLILLSQSKILGFHRSTFLNTARLLRAKFNFVDSQNLVVPDFYRFLRYVEMSETSVFSLKSTSCFFDKLLANNMLNDFNAYYAKIASKNESTLRSTLLYNLAVMRSNHAIELNSKGDSPLG